MMRAANAVTPTLLEILPRAVAIVTVPKGLVFSPHGAYPIFVRAVSIVTPHVFRIGLTSARAKTRGKHVAGPREQTLKVLEAYLLLASPEVVASSVAPISQGVQAAVAGCSHYLVLEHPILVIHPFLLFV